MTPAAKRLVEVAVGPVSGRTVSACLSGHPDYPHWCKSEISEGHEIHTMSVGDLLQKIHSENSK